MSDTLTKKRINPWMISLIAVLIAHLSNQFSNIGWKPLVVPIREALGLTTAQSGTLIGIAGIVSVIAALPAGWLCNKFGEKRILVCGFVLSGAGMILLSMATTYETALMGRSVWQFFYRISLISTMAATALAVPTHFRGRAMGLNGAFANIGALSGAPLGAFIANALGWKYAFWVYAGFLVVGILAVGIFFKPYVDPDAPVVTVEKAKDAPKQKSVFLIPIVWSMAFLMFFSSTGGTITSFIPLQLADIFAADITIAAFLQTLGQGVGIVINPLFGVIADRVGRFKTLIGMCALAAALYVGMTIPNYYVYIFCAGVVQFLGVGTLNMVYACGGDLMRGRGVGAISGVTAIGTGAAQFFLSTFLGNLKDMTGSYFVGQMVCVGMAVCAAVLAAALIAYMKKNQPADAGTAKA